MRTREILRQAKKDGIRAGEAAASWCFDGNSSDETYRKVLAGLDAGDPEVLDSFNVPNLSGEMAGDPTPQSLCEDYGLGNSEDDARTEVLVDKICQTWEDAASAAFWGEIERVCRYHVAV